MSDSGPNEGGQKSRLPPEGQARVGRFGAAGMPVEKSDDIGRSLRRLWALLRRERVRLFAVLALSVTSVAFVVIGPRILGRATDVIVRGFTSGQGVDLGRLHRTLTLAVALYAVAWAAAYGQSFLLAGVVQRTMFGLRNEVERKLHRLPLSYIDTHSRGDLLSRVTNDIDNVAQSLQQTTSQILTSTLTLVGVTVMMFSISPLLAAAALVTVPASVLAIRLLSRRSRPRFVAQWRHTGALNGQAEEAFTGHTVLKAFGRQHEAEERFGATNDELYAASFGAQFTSSIIQPAMQFLGNIQYVIVAVVGGIRVANGAISIGDVQAFIQYSRQFSQPLTQLASMANTFQSGLASLERVVALLDADEQRPDADPGEGSTPARGRVVFDDVSFSYDPATPLIEALSLVAEPGQTVAIVGPTGAGKTTLVNLIMRFYEVDSGVISIDGRDITTMPRAELRSQIGMVLQDTWLFGGTIRDNILYGNPGASEADMLEAAQATYVERFVHSLPDGYDTVIADDGDNISAGEKQLLTIARAFLAEPQVLILDEATSSVDTRTEVLIQEAMNTLRARRTSFVIAHRLSTIRNADVILVMDDGHIVEQGDHDDLLARDGAYAALYNAQFQGAAADVL